MGNPLSKSKQKLWQLWRSTSSLLVAAVMAGISALGVAIASPSSVAARPAGSTTTVAASTATLAECTPGGSVAAGYNAANLGQFNTALSQAATKPVNIVYVGDSLTEGYGATSDTTRFQNVLNKNLQKAYNPSGITGGEGWIPFWHQTYWSYQRWTKGNTDNGGAQPQLYTNPGYGLGQRGGVLSGNQYGQITFYGDRFWLMYTQGVALGYLGVSIDNKPYTSIWTNASTEKSGRIWDSGSLKRGNHTVKVKAMPLNGQPGLAVADGIMTFDGEGSASTTLGKGIRMWDDGMSGASVASFNDTNNRYSDSTNDTVNPNLIVIGLGANDSLYYDASTYASLLTTMINKYRNGSGAIPPAPNASILLWIEPNRADLDPAAWQTYVDAVYQVASSQGTGLVDMNARMGKAVVGDFFIDTIHGTDAGYRMLADGIGQALGAVQCAPISGIITDAATGTPLQGMCVTAIDSTTNKPVSYARTAADGTYTIWTTPGTYNLKNWDCAGTGYTTSMHNGTVAGNTSGITDTMSHP